MNIELPFGEGRCPKRTVIIEKTLTKKEMEVLINEWENKQNQKAAVAGILASLFSPLVTSEFASYVGGLGATLVTSCLVDFFEGEDNALRNLINKGITEVDAELKFMCVEKGRNGHYYSPYRLKLY